MGENGDSKEFEERKSENPFSQMVRKLLHFSKNGRKWGQRRVLHVKGKTHFPRWLQIKDFRNHGQ